MIYFLINNDYHYRLLQKYNVFDTKLKIEFCSIKVPHTLRSNAYDEFFIKNYTFHSPIFNHSLPTLAIEYLKMSRVIYETLDVNENDVLLFFTEVELLNQIIAKKFYDSNAKIYMIEDGGFATFVPMMTNISERLSVKEKIIEKLYNLIPTLRKTKFHKFNDNLFPRLPDDIIDGIILQHDVKLRRNIDIIKVKKPELNNLPNLQNRIIFLNEKIYEFYQSDEQYFYGLRVLLNYLTSTNLEVFFKFHPGESAYYKKRISRMISTEFPEIQFLNGQDIIENLLDTYKPKIIASYFSATLLNIEYNNIQALYLYHLLDDLREQKVFQVTSAVLSSMKYNFVDKNQMDLLEYEGFAYSDDDTNKITFNKLLSHEMLVKST